MEPTIDWSTMPNNEVFTCWKEIANYLNRGVRTVQRWEIEEGLPVRRPNSRSKGTVQAHRKELDDWMAAREFRKDTEDGIRPKAPLVANHKELLFDFRSAIQRCLGECKNLIAEMKRSESDLLSDRENR